MAGVSHEGCRSTTSGGGGESPGRPGGKIRGCGGSGGSRSGAPSRTSDNSNPANKHTQLLVIDPAAFIEGVKSQLAEKQGIPEKQQRLIFAARLGSGCEESSCESYLPSSRGISTTWRNLQPEELVAECSSWKAILFEDGRAIGQLCTPKLCTDIAGLPVELSSDIQQLLLSLGIRVAIHQLVYDRWLPSWVRGKGASKPLYIPLDDKFRSSVYRIQVFGALNGQTFAFPHVFQARGKELAAALSLNQQRAEYVARHQQQRIAICPPVCPDPLPPSLHPGDVTVTCGRGFERLGAIIDSADKPAWLKRFILPLAVAVIETPKLQVPQQLSVSCDIQGRSSGLQGAESKADNATRAEGSKRLFGATKQSNCKKKKNRRKHSQHRHFFALESGLEAPLEGARAVEEDQSSAMSLELARSQEQEGSMDRSAGSLEGEDGSSGESASEKTASLRSPQTAQNVPNSKPVVDGLHDAGLRPDSRNGKRVEVTSGLSLPLGHAAQPVKGGYAAAAAKQPPPPVPARPPASPKRAGPSAAGAGLPLSAGSTPPKPCRTPPRPRNGHRVVLRSEALARIIPHLQGVGGEPGASGALAETPGSEVLLSGLSLNQGWESPVAIPRSGFRSACATPTSTSSSSRPLLPSSPEPELDLPQPPVLDGAIPSPFLQTEEEEGHKQQPSAQEQRQRPERGKLRRRWSADLDCTDSSDCGPDQSPRCLETPSWPKHTDGSGHWLEMETGASQSIPPTDQTTQPLEPLLQMKATSSSRPVHCFIEKTGGAAEEKPKPLRGPSRSPAEVTGHQDLTPERRPPMASAAPPESRAAGHIESSPPWEPDVGSSPGASSVTASECSNNSEEGGGFDSSIPVAKHLQTDLERLLVQVIPMIDLEAGARMASQRKIGNLTLDTIWEWFEESSCYGREVYTLGGSRGASMSYYIPFLSAVRLFSPVYSKESTSQERPGEVFTCDMEGFPPKMRLVYQFIETSAPKDRPPLNQKIESLYEGEGSQDAGPSAAGSWDPRLIRDLHFQDIHPHSWFAVSWYPIYRIPDAPLKAAFLTYHTLAPIAAMLQPLHQQRLRSAGGGGGAGSSAASAAGSAAGQGSGALGSAGSSGQAGSSGGLRASPRGSSLLNLPVVGLEWYAMGDEAWCETRSAVKDTSPGTQRAENAWKAYISELRGTAGRLARSLGARGGRTLHHDYNFFNLRN